MSASDASLVIGNTLSVLALLQDGHVLAAVAVLLVAGLIADIKRKGGFAEWAERLVSAAERWAGFIDDRREARQKHRTRRLLGRQKRRRLRDKDREKRRKRAERA